MSDSSTPAPIPVTVLSGFLGSGKTTLMNHLLQHIDRSRVAIVENELGDISIDHHLVTRTDLGSMDVVHGRTCCSTREELLDILRNLAHSDAGYERLLIETTGVAHPGMVAHAILGDVFLKDRLRLDGVVTVVDAKHLLAHLGRDGHADEQIAYADVVIVNKTDLVDAVQLERVEQLVRSINSDCRLVRATQAQVDPATALEIGGYEQSRISHGVSGCSSDRAPASGSLPGLKSLQRHEIGTVSLALEGELDANRFCRWLEQFIEANQTTVYRAKGIIALRGVPERMIFQGVHGLFQLTLGEPWQPSEQRGTQLVVIGRKLDRPSLNDALEACR